MARTRRRGATARLVFWAAFMLAGAGAGAAAVLAVSGSGLIRAAGGAAGGIAGLCSAAWADTARQRREEAAAAIAERGQVLGPLTSEPAHDDSILGLLLPTRQIAAPFRGRVADLALLQAWLDNLHGHPAALIAGPGGTGKTRLAAQFAATLPPSWAAGWLAPGCGATALAAVRACNDPTLILIDDAGTSPDTAALLAALADQPPAPQVRVLLTARTSSALTQAASTLPEQARWILALDNLPVFPIGPFGSTGDHARWFGEAARSYAAARHTPPPDLPAIPVTENASSKADEPVLFIQAQALLAVLETQRRRPHHTGPQALPFDQVAEALFTHEQRRWQQAAQQPGSGLADLDTTLQQRAIAALTLSHAATEPDAVTALRAIPDLADATAERLARIARWAFSLYPPPPVQIQPDMLAEWFLITQLTTAPALAAHLDDPTAHHTSALLILLAHASDHMPAAIPLYARLIHADPPGLAAAAADAALTASTAQPQLDAVLAALITSTHWTPETLDHLNRHLPEGTLPRTRAAISAATLDHAREIGTPDDLAQALHRHGDHLADLGRHPEALAAKKEALALYRDLAANAAHQPSLANTLRCYGNSLSDLGRHREALAANEEALAVWRDLVAANPAHQPDLAGTMTNYGISLGDLGRHREALAAKEEALALWRDLAAANPAHQPYLAGAMTNYGISLRNLGRHREALAANEEALAVWRDLVAANPAHQPDLAGALNGYGASLRDLGRHREALAAFEESLAVWRDLVAANPAHQPSLANTLNGYGASLRDLGRHREALAAFEKALALRRDLAAANPAHQPSLANTLNSYGASLRDLGRHREALAAFEKALALRRDLAAANPAHQPDLANTLNSYSASLSDLGRHREALAAKEEALTLWRDLAAANPAHQPDLANTLNNFGATLRDLGRHEEALTYDREALELYAILARNDPGLYEQTYQHHLAELRRTYDRRGDQSTSISLHLPRDTKDSHQPSQSN